MLRDGCVSHLSWSSFSPKGSVEVLVLRGGCMCRFLRKELGDGVGFARRRHVSFKSARIFSERIGGGAEGGVGFARLRYVSLSRFPFSRRVWLGAQ